MCTWPEFYFWYWWEILPWLWVSIGVTHSYSSHPFLCALGHSYPCAVLFFVQATLQFCIVKPIVAVATIILEACNVYHEGTLRYVYKISNEWVVNHYISALLFFLLPSAHTHTQSPTAGYFYCTIAYNLSVTLALYGLVLFYAATRALLSKYHPVLKFLAIKSIVFLSFWQGTCTTVVNCNCVVPMTTTIFSVVMS